MNGKPRPSLRPKMRLLTTEEAVLWVEVTKTVKARPGATLPGTPKMDAGTPPALMDPMPPASVQAAVPELKKTPRPLPLAPLERRMKQRLSRGRIDIDASVDLHGLRQAEAHAQLRRFLFVSQRAGARIVLVVTGKGRSVSDSQPWIDRGVLRRSVPLWLAEPDLRHVVLAFEEASAAHGGAGALYIRLRRGAAERGRH